MTASFNPATTSIDGLITWLREQRSNRPTTPLSELIDLTRLPIDRLTDLACIDLIERRRIGRPVCVEEILREIPKLAQSETAKLDLVDAEICVRVESDETIDTQEYNRRFPELAHAIVALAKLNHAAGKLPSPLMTELSLPRCDDAVQTRLIGRSHFLANVVQPPDWFTSEQLQSSSERSCLVRGRDSRQNRAVAMKVIRLTHAVTKDEVQLLLDSVESTSSVRHPAWIAPDIAAIEKQSLAVIRPWIFGMRWDQARRHATTQTRLGDLARIGYALQAAHDTPGRNGHAAHGGLHLNNLLVDAEGQVRIVDALVSVQPAAGEVFGSSIRINGDDRDLCLQRRSSDVRSLCAFVRVVTSGGFANEPTFRKQANSVDRLCQKLIDQPDQANACGILADALINLADGNIRESNDYHSLPIQSRFTDLFRRSLRR